MNNPRRHGHEVSHYVALFIITQSDTTKRFFNGRSHPSDTDNMCMVASSQASSCPEFELEQQSRGSHGRARASVVEDDLAGALGAAESGGGAEDDQAADDSREITSAPHYIECERSKACPVTCGCKARENTEGHHLPVVYGTYTSSWADIFPQGGPLPNCFLAKKDMCSDCFIHCNVMMVCTHMCAEHAVAPINCPRWMDH